MQLSLVALLVSVAAAWRVSSPSLLQIRQHEEDAAGDASAQPKPLPKPTRTVATTPTSLTSTTAGVKAPSVTPYEAMPCTGGAVLTTPTMSLALYDKVVASVAGLAAGLPSNCTESYCPQAEWTGCVLRMAGHDFMDYKSGTGGSDGCTDLGQDDNGGLSACLYQGEHGVSLYDAYKSYCSQVSLADFLVIAGEAVMNFTRGLALVAKPTGPSVDFRSKFRYGRTTAINCTFATGRLPDAEMGCNAVESVFVNNMDLTWTEAAALMGTHTLGRARIANSGYDGWWTSPEGSRQFNNDYFGYLFSKGWKPERVAGNPGKNQWTRSDVGASLNPAGKQMMLNTDMCLAYQNATDAATQSCCAWASPRAFKEAVAADNGDYCGSTTLPTSSDPREQFGKLRQLCCVGVSNGPGKDCDTINNPQGKAIAAVTLFSKSEASWLASLYTAWAKATTNGFSGLKTPTAQ